MENLTHTLTGLFLSRTGLNRLGPDATAVLLVSANLPDADVVCALGGLVPYFRWHRHLTHSLIAAPALAALTAFLFFSLRRRNGFVPLLWAASAGIVSHLLLDLTNVYGVRLFVPFSAQWIHWDLTPIVDVWIWSAFGVCLLGPFLSRLVGSEMGAKRPRYPGRGFAALALFFLVAYTLARVQFHSRATAVLNTRDYGGRPPLRVAAIPAGQNPFTWTGIAETSDAYYLAPVGASARFDPEQTTTVAKAEASRAIDAANSTPAFRAMADFAQFPVYRVFPEPSDGTRVELSDVRFSFVSTALLDREGQVIESSLSLGRLKP